MRTHRLTVLGDSFVEGRGDPGPTGEFRGWVPTLASLLGIRSGGWRNLGAHQATTQVVVDTQLARAVAHKSPLIGVVVGTNDLVSDYDPARYRANIDRIVGELSGFDTTVFIATHPDIPANLPVPEPFRDLLRARFAEANEHLRDVARRSDLILLDIARCPRWADPAVWSADGLHPNPAGHRLFAETVAALVTEGDLAPLAA